MSKEVIIERTAPGGVMPRCVSAILQYDGPTFEDEHSLPAPVGLVNHSWSKVVKAFAEVLTSLETLALLPFYADSTEPLTTRVLNDYHQLLARSAEFTEDVEDNLGLCMSPSKKKFRKLAGSPSARKAITVPLNSLKHNHNRLIYIQATHNFARVPSVAFYHVAKKALRPNEMIHKGRNAFSFNTELRSVLFQLYSFSEKSAGAIAAVEGNTSSSTATASDAPTIDVIKRIQALPAHGILEEKSSHMPVIDLRETLLFMKSDSGTVIEQPQGTQIQMHFTGDGSTRSFVLPSEPRVS